MIKGFSKVFPLGFDEHALNTLLQTGDYFLIAEGDAQQPLLRDGNKISFYIDEDGKSQQQTEQEWQFTSTSYAEHLSASLRFAIMQTPKPILSVAVRQKDKEDNKSKQKEQKSKNDEIYWLELQCEYKTDSKAGNSSSGEAVDNLPYKVEFSDGTIKEGSLKNGFARLNNIPAGQVKVEFGYPKAEEELVKARKELKQYLDEIIAAVKERGDMLDKALEKESIPMQGLIITGAFFDGLFATGKDSIDAIEELASDLVQEARVKLDNWEGIADSVKYQAIEFVEDRHEDLLDFVAEVDEKRQAVEEALKTGNTKKLKSEMEELATYAVSKAANANAYAVKSIEELTEVYNHYALLFEDKEIGRLLKEFPGKYYEAMPTVEAAQACGGGGFSILTAVLTGGAVTGVAVGAFVMSKMALFKKIGALIKKIIKLLERKKKTPTSPVVKQNNELVEVKVEKPKKEDVKEKEKKKCSFCKKDYNPKCPNANSKVSYFSETKGSGSELTKSIVSTRDNDYSKIEDHSWYFQRKQGTKNRRSIEAHHIIVSETMNDDYLKEMCEDFGYNINHHKNGVMLPYYMDLACHLGVPLHRGGHDAGQGDQNLSYPRSVEKKVESLKKRIEKGKICEKGYPRKQFLIAINKISDDIFKKIKNFEWTITADGIHYDIRKSNVGCGNKVNIPDKEGDFCIVRDKSSKENHVHDFPESKIKIEPNQRSKLKIGQ